MLAQIVSTAVIGRITQHIISAIAQAMASKGVNMSEIQSLTSQIQRLDGVVDFWNRWYIAFVAMTVIFGACLFFVQFMSIRRSAERAIAQKRLDHLKEDANKESITGIQNEAAGTNERAGKLEKAAAELTAANLKLEAIIAPRRLSAEQQRDLSTLTVFSNRRVGLKSYASDVEGLVLASQIFDALAKAHIPIEDNRLTMQSSGSISFGVSINGTDNALVVELRRILGNLASTSTMPVSPSRAGISTSLSFGTIKSGLPVAATIVVGVKPIK
jgi:hypothetical protein